MHAAPALPAQSILITESSPAMERLSIFLPLLQEGSWEAPMQCQVSATIHRPPGCSDGGFGGGPSLLPPMPHLRTLHSCSLGLECSSPIFSWFTPSSASDRCLTLAFQQGLSWPLCFTLHLPLLPPDIPDLLILTFPEHLSPCRVLWQSLIHDFYHWVL